MTDRHLGFLPPLLAMVVLVVVSPFAYRLAQYLYIRSAYGAARWEHGLRVVDKHGHLSDGTTLSWLGQAAVYPGTFLLCLPVVCVAVYAFTYLAMRLRGERLGEQLDRLREAEGRRTS